MNPSKPKRVVSPNSNFKSNLKTNSTPGLPFMIPKACEARSLKTAESVFKPNNRPVKFTKDLGGFDFRTFDKDMKQIPTIVTGKPRRQGSQMYKTMYPSNRK